MQDDPRQIAEWLVQEHGLVQARAEALSGLLAAQKEGDFYALSVWRDVRRILEAQAKAETSSRT